MNPSTAFAATLAMLALASGSIAGGPTSGTPAEARSMLERAVTAMKADKGKALVMFTRGEAGFKDRDLYPYCGGPDGYFTAHPTLTGRNLRELKDKVGKSLGEEVYAMAKEGQIVEVAYMWPRPGQTEPVQKVAYVTRIGDQVCAVGYYK